MRGFRRIRLCFALLLIPFRQAAAQSSEPLFDPAQLPAFSGTLDLFTLTPHGDIDGFVLTDGTEVKTPPHLTVPLSATVRPGSRVTVHGLKAAALPLVRAMSVTDEASGRSVIDAGPDRRAPGAPEPRGVRTGPVSVQGTVRMPLHGPRGDVNGALLVDGTVLRMPPPEALRFAALLEPGQALAAEGRGRATLLGRLVEVTALGPSADRLSPVRVEPGPRPPA